MLLPGVLGFHGILVFCLLVFGLVIRQKWRDAAVRKLEVTNLLNAVAEESLMVESEAASQYNCMPGFYQCAVCFLPTTTRCSRCKAVRYCSGKCQIIDWRQGHKDACCPLITTMPLREDVTTSQKQLGRYDNDSEIVMDNDSNLKPCADAEGTHFNFPSISSAAGSHMTRFRNEFDDVSPNGVSESGNIDRLERPSADAVSPCMLGTKTRVKKMKQKRSPSSEFINSVANIGATSCASKSNALKLSHNDEEVNFRSQLPSGKAMPDNVRLGKLGDKKPVGGGASPELLIKDSSKSKNSLSVSGSMLESIIKDSKDDSTLSKGKDVKSSSLTAPRTSSASAGQSHSISKSLLPSKNYNIPSLPQNACHGFKTSMQKVVQQFRAFKPSKSHMLGSETEVAENYNEMTIFPYDLFVKLYSCDKVELSPFGLTNCGNSCYANAVLQCLAFTQPLGSYLVQRLHSRACRNKEWCFICEFECLILKAREGNSPVSPIGILSKIEKIGSHLGHGREEDAHEFLRYAVDTMQSVCLKEAGTKGKLAEETTLIGLTFGGFLLSKIKCLKCHSKSEQCERMMDLTVEIDGDIGTLEDALAQFTATEILAGENKYHCDRCKSYEKAKKKLMILEEPNILTVVLKRFQPRNFGKLNKSVQFPDVLSIAPYMSETGDRSPVYSLYAVVVHLDVMNTALSGHYVCYVKDSHGEWFKIDDSTVTPVELEKVLLQEAYMLLYASSLILRLSPRLPTLMRNNKLSHSVKLKRRSWEAVPSDHNASKQKSNFDAPASQKLDLTSNQMPYGDEWRYPSMRRIPTVDSLSESSSIFSWSDASSCSTASTKDSSRSEDITDFIFGEMGPSWYSRYGNLPNSVTSSSQNFDVDSYDWRDGWRPDGNLENLHYEKLSHRFVSNSCKGSNSHKVIWTNPYDPRLRRASENTSAQTFY
ncbi:ubiquitin carboxyl-terminal hydrolase 17-like isoform X3 [Mangifera indica]|uniref:ubiquitin carboxyl-terminal hydrolase 17-like isoform X3 n=1 Tax=Mangifera indica TaxID=29780 RepID=UPI001CFA71D1|nr:ubiquitin carboxyl-terminal hydrolase 17-like isoform X3 [Mangifera indica]